MTNLTKNELKIVDKFFNSILKPSDFKFEWRVAKSDNIDWDAVHDECTKTGLSEKFDNAKDGIESAKIATQIALVMKAHTKKNQTYQLLRHCTNGYGIVHAISKMNKRDAAKAKKSANYIVMKTAYANDQQKHSSLDGKKFSSLSKMQAWLDKNNIKVDAYKAYDVWTKLRK